MEKISVIIPVYKVEQYLRQCLDSVVNQTYKDLEIIIIDDGSPDGCGAICDEYAARDERIVVIHKQNGGLSAARNDGIRKATGKWITFVDSDDWLEKDYFQTMAPILQNEAPDVICAGGVYLEEGENTVTGRIFCEKRIWNATDNRDWLVVKILTGNIGDKKQPNERLVRLGAAWDKICRTEFIRENNLYFDEKDRAWEDIWYSVNVVKQARTVIGCDCIGYHYRAVDTSITKGFNENKPKINHKFIDKIRNLYNDTSSADIYQAIDAFSIHLFNNALACCYLNPNCALSEKQIKQRIMEMKMWPNFHRAIYSKGTHYLTRNLTITKFLLRLPSARPLVFAFRLNKNMKKRR